jgi:hypothetical protein
MMEIPIRLAVLILYHTERIMVKLVEVPDASDIVEALELTD